MIADFSKETLEHFNISPEKQKQIRECLLLYKKLEYYEKKQKGFQANKLTFCEDCKVNVTHIERHYKSKKHRRLVDPMSLIED